MELNVETNAAGDVTIISIPMSHLDASNCEELEHALTSILEDHERILLDLSDLQFIDSSGVGVLLFSIRKIEGRGGRMRICCPTEPVRMALDLVRIHRLIDICSSRAEALAAFEKDAATP